MDLTVVVSCSAGRELGELLRTLPAVLDRLELDWQVWVRSRSLSGLPDSNICVEGRPIDETVDPRIVVAPASMDLAEISRDDDPVERDSLLELGDLVVTTTGSACDLHQIAPIVDTLRSGNADIVLPFVSRVGTRRASWALDALGSRLFSVAMRRRLRSLLHAPRGYRRDVLEGARLCRSGELNVLADAFATGKKVVQVPVPASLRSPLPGRRGWLRSLGLVLERRPLLSCAFLAGVICVAAVVVGSSAGVDWIVRPQDDLEQARPMAIGCLALLGAQGAIFAYLWDRQDGLRRHDLGNAGP